MFFSENTILIITFYKHKMNIFIITFYEDKNLHVSKFLRYRYYINAFEVLSR